MHSRKRQISSEGGAIPPPSSMPAGAFSSIPDRKAQILRTMPTPSGSILKRLDFVVLSHRHNDHTAGLNHVLHENPGVTIYTPLEVAGFNFPCRRAHGSTPPCLHPEARPTRRLQCEHR